MTSRDQSSAAEGVFDGDPPVADEGPGAPFVWPAPEPVRLPPRKPRCTQPGLLRIECYGRQLSDVTADAVAAVATARQRARALRALYQDPGQSPQRGPGDTA